MKMETTDLVQKQIETLEWLRNLGILNYGFYSIRLSKNSIECQGKYDFKKLANIKNEFNDVMQFYIDDNGFVQVAFNCPENDMPIKIVLT